MSTQERPPLETIDSLESGSSEDSGLDQQEQNSPESGRTYGEMQFTPATTMDGGTPFMSSSAINIPTNGTQPHPPKRTGSLGTMPTPYENQTEFNIPSRSHRPSAPARQPSNTYNPIRRPNQFITIQSGQTHANGVRSPSVSRSRKDANAQYRAEERAYIDRMRQDQINPYFQQQSPPSLGYSTETETDDESPMTDAPYEDDPYDQDTQLYFGDDDDMQPSAETASIPANKERLEWHGMLQIVMKGDVVSQEKRRIFGGSAQLGGTTAGEDVWTRLRTRIGGRSISAHAVVEDLWIGFRAKVCGRSIPAQRRIIEEGRSKLDSMMDHITDFSIRGVQKTGMTPMEEALAAIKEIDKISPLFRCWQDFEIEKPRATSKAFTDSIETLMAWVNVTQLLEGQFKSLHKWVGNEELNLNKSAPSSPRGLGLADESSFIDRLLKVDGLSALQGSKNMLTNIAQVILIAKQTHIEFKDLFAKRHLPSYIEELQNLINFPTRLIEEVVRFRLHYAKKMKDPAQQGMVNIDQTLAQFKILFELAVRVKLKYIEIAEPSPGWDIPSCIDENFDNIVLEALQFYFKMLTWKLSGNKNTFKEAEVLEEEWEFAQQIGRHFDGGDVEVAEQFSSLTSKLLSRLTTHFEKNLQRRVNEPVSDMEKRYKANLDSVRVRQRMLYRFSRGLGQRFENSTEYNLKMDIRLVRQVFDALIETNHFVINNTDQTSVVIIASPGLWEKPKDIQSILGTCSDGESIMEENGCPYVLVISPEEPLLWDGRRATVDLRDPVIDFRTGRLRLVTNGSGQSRLAIARSIFAQQIQMNLDVLIEQRANLPRVNAELMKIKKTTYKLSNAIMGSVNLIQKQMKGLDCQDLIQTCFVFATESGQRSLMYMDNNRRALNNLRLTLLAIDWLAFICDDCVAASRQTFRWAVVALEFAMKMTQGQNLLSITEEDWDRLQTKVGACMSLLISHFDIMGARSTLAAQAEAKRLAALSGAYQPDLSNMTNDDEATQHTSSW
jgi:mitogen-activated protein kinase kinase kinase